MSEITAYTCMPYTNCAVVGAAFNPPHLGHVDVVRQLAETGRFQRVLLAPAAAHPDKPDDALAPFAERLAMLEAMAPEWGRLERRFGIEIGISGIEASLRRAGRRVYTIDLLLALREAAPRQRFAFVLGPDYLPDGWRSFREAARIEREFGFVFVEQRLPQRSTSARALARAGAWAALAAQVAAPVLEHIRDRRTYAAAAVEPR